MRNLRLLQLRYKDIEIHLINWFGQINESTKNLRVFTCAEMYYFLNSRNGSLSIGVIPKAKLSRTNAKIPI